VFLLDSKFFDEPSKVEGDALVIGRHRYDGAGFRGPAYALSEQLARLAPPRPWVQAVAVIWGTFPQREVEADRAAYIGAHGLFDWLQRQPERISEQRRRSLSTRSRSSAPRPNEALRKVDAPVVPRLSSSVLRLPEPTLARSGPIPRGRSVRLNGKNPK